MVKLQGKNQISNQNESKPRPALTLKLNPETKELYLQVNDKTSNETVRLESNGKNSEFCSICNAPVCKLKNNFSNINLSGKLDSSSTTSGSPSASKSDSKSNSKSNSNMMTIVVSKNELCRTICKDSGNVSSTSTSTTQSGNVSSTLATQSGHVSSPSTSATQNVDKNGEYCPLCDAPKCKITDPVFENSKRSKDDANQRSNDGTENLEKTRMIENIDSSDLIRIRVDRAEICRQICNIEEVSTRSSSATSSSATSSTSTYVSSTSLSTEEQRDKAKSPDYCPICDLPKCKLVSPDEPTNTSNINSKSISNVSNSKNVSNTDEDIKKSPTYCSACNLPKCKYETSAKDKTIGTSTKDKTSETSTKAKTAENSTEIVKSTSITSDGSSDMITISIDRSEICRLCNEGETLSTSSPTDTKAKIEDKTVDKTEENSKDKTKDSEYCPMCDSPKCKLVKNVGDKWREKSKKVNMNSHYSVYYSGGRHNYS